MKSNSVAKLVRLNGARAGFFNSALVEEKPKCLKSLVTLGITVYKEVMSIVQIRLFSPEKLKLRKISNAWLMFGLLMFGMFGL